jgi:2Fe-2S ferredoxin
VTLRLEIDGCAVDAPEGNAIFALAELAGVRVPTSCHGNGKCRECMVEVLEGGALLSPREAVEEPLGPTFRLACRARAAGGEGQVSCRTLRRGGMRIETESALAAGDSAGPESLAESGSGCCHDAPHASRVRELRPAVTRAGGRIWLGDESIEDREGPFSAWRWTSARPPWPRGCLTSGRAPRSRRRLSKTRSALAAAT